MKPNALNWDHCQSFLAVFETRSLSAAAKKLGLSQPTLGRHINALEADIGASLFVRSRYGLSPTELAQNMLPHARSMASAASAIQRTTSRKGDVEGTVRLTASEIVGVEILPRILAAFAEKHPLIHIELALTNRTENLLRREADIAIRMKRPVQDALVARKIGDVPVCLYAHESYFENHDMPETMESFSNHMSIGPDSLTYRSAIVDVANFDKLHKIMTFKSDSDLAQLAMVRAGYGIGGIQKQLAARYRELVPVLHDQFSIAMEMWLVTHEDIINTPPIRLFFDHLSSHLEAYVHRRN